jgi:hypothetical protein
MHENGAILGASVHGSVRIRLVSVTARADDECKVIRAHHALDCGIFLDGKIADLV